MRSHRLRRLLGIPAALILVLAACGCGAASRRPETTRAVAGFDRALHDALPETVRAGGELRVATDASYAPASSFGPDGRTIVGFEPDLGAALGHVLGVKVRFVNTGFDKVLPDVAAHRTDLVMSAVTDTPERERTVDFVNYFSAGTAIVVQRGNPAGITDLVGLCGHNVAVEKGTIQVDLLARSQKQCTSRRIQVKTYDTNADALLQLRTGRTSAVLNDYPPATAVSTDARTRSHYQLASTTQYEPGLYGIAVAKDQFQLRDAVQAALDRLIRSGEYGQILRRWNVTDGSISATSINAGATAAAG